MMCRTDPYKHLDFGKLAVVIPTMNRGEFLARAVRWYRRSRIPICIGDSSKIKITESSDLTLDTHYYHTPLSNEIKASWEAGFHSTAPYLAWAGDDDFLLPQALKRSIEILDACPEITSVAGYATIFATIDNEVWNPIESVVGGPDGPYPDHFFRVFRREIIMEGWRLVKDLPTPEPDTKENHLEGACIRSTKLLEYLLHHDHLRKTIDMLSLLRQVHPGRVTSILGGPEPWRARLGHAFPRIQYAKQWVQSWNQPLSLPALRRKQSPFYEDFHPVEEFLSHA